MRWWCAAILVLPALALGQPEGLTRAIRTIDFEERRLGNPEELPMHWAKVTGKDYPHYVNGRLDTDQHRSGKYSFRFELNGGSLVYRYEPRRVPVQVGAHYRVEVYVRTTPLPNARARLTAYFVDSDGKPIEKSIRHSEPYAAKRVDDAWKALSVELSADDTSAEGLAIELELLQPALYAASTLGSRAIFPQDIHGTAWFDDLTVAQVPKVRMSADRPGNIYRRNQALSLQVFINDRFTSDLAAQLVIRDALSKVVYQRSGALDISAAEDTRAGEKRVRLVLPALQPGWYEAALVMTSNGQLLGEQKLDLVLLADDAPAPTPDPRFGLIATDLPFEGWAELPEILPTLAAGRIKLAVWNSQGSVHQVDPTGFDQLLVRLQEMHITPTACLIEPPPSVAKRLRGQGWIGLLNAEKGCLDDLAHLVSRHAAHLDRWQLGADNSDAFVTTREMRQVYDKVYQQFATLLQNPDLAMPWPAWYELEGRLPATVALSVPPSVLPNQLPLYMQDIHRHRGHNLSLSLQLLSREAYGREMQIRDLAQRVIYALSANAKRIDIPLPFTVQRSGEHLVKQPQELLMIVRTLMATLSGAEFKGMVPIAEDVEAFLFDRSGQGIIALWDRGSTGGMKKLTLHLGEKPMCVDLWGNVTPMLRPKDAAGSGQVQLSLGAMPMFVVDIDGPLNQLRASVGFDRPLIESSFSAHTRKIRFTNPYKQSISGSLKLAGPAGWTLSPPTFAFSVNPGETFERDVTIEFPYSSFAGPKTISADFQIQADRTSAVRVPITLTLGLSDVGMQTMALRDGKDILVQQMITNYGDKPIDYTAFATYPGQARQERLVTNLAPGRSTIKRYRFTQAKFDASYTVRAGVKELNGSRILNQQIEIH